MKFFKAIFLMALTLLISVPMLGFQEAPDTPGLDFSDPKTFVTYLIPLIVLGATWVFKKVFSKISGTYTLLIAAGLSALVAFLNSQLQDPDAGWTIQFLLGLGSTFIHQLSKMLDSNKS